MEEGVFCFAARGDDRLEAIRVGSVSDWSLPLPAGCGCPPCGNVREQVAGYRPQVVRYRSIDEEDLWVLSSRSAASACRRRSTARCFAVPAFSGGSSASRKPPAVGSVAFSPAAGRRGPRITGGCAFRRFRGRVPWQRSLQGGSCKCRRRAFGRHLPLPRCGYRCHSRAPACQRAMSAAPALSRVPHPLDLRPGVIGD